MELSPQNQKLKKYINLHDLLKLNKLSTLLIYIHFETFQ